MSGMALACDCDNRTQPDMGGVCSRSKYGWPGQRNVVVRNAETRVVAWQISRPNNRSALVVASKQQPYSDLLISRSTLPSASLLKLPIAKD